MPTCCICWVGPRIDAPNTTQTLVVVGARVALHVDFYRQRLLGHCDNHITCKERPSHGVWIHTCHDGGIMAPLIGPPPIIHHGGHCSILNRVAKTFGLHSSYRVTPIIFSSGSLYGFVLCKMKPNERLV